MLNDMLRVYLCSGRLLLHCLQSDRASGGSAKFLSLKLCYNQSIDWLMDPGDRIVQYRGLSVAFLISLSASCGRVNYDFVEQESPDGADAGTTVSVGTGLEVPGDANIFGAGHSVAPAIRSRWKVYL